MKKLTKRTYKGINYIRLGSLSREQAESLRKSLNPRTLIKIQIYDELLEDCVLYEAYEDWYENYQQELTPQPTIAGLKDKSISLT